LIAITHPTVMPPRTYAEIMKNFVGKTREYISKSEILTRPTPVQYTHSKATRSCANHVRRHL
jgi:hypothetical protein